jgi:hypothetical protein
MSKASFYHTPVRMRRRFAFRRRATNVVADESTSLCAPQFRRRRPLSMRRIALARMREQHNH